MLNGAEIVSQQEAPTSCGAPDAQTASRAPDGGVKPSKGAHKRRAATALFFVV